MKKLILLAFFMAIIAGYFPTLGISDIVKLKDGREVEGVIKENNGKIIKLKVKIGEINFAPSEIDSVIMSTNEENSALEKSWLIEKGHEPKLEPDTSKKKPIEKIDTEVNQAVEEKKKELPASGEASSDLQPDSAQGDVSSITWLDDYNAGIYKASKIIAPIIIDFYTDWCGWCRKLDDEVYTDQRIKNLSRKFVCIKINGDNNKDLTAKFKVGGYPTIVFLNSDAKEIDRIPGFVGADAFYSKMQKVMKK